jgi:cytochrome d ubiquinol oxidase subunit I
VAARRNSFGIEVPYGLSLLARHELHAEIAGLDRVPEDQWPHVPTVHLAFQLMVALGTFMAIVGLWTGWLAWRRVPFESRPGFLTAAAVAAPMGFLAVEAGWTVTEVGRQPWTIYGVLRTADAVTPMPGLIVPFVGFTLLYVGLAAIVVWLLYRQILRSPTARDVAPAPEEAMARG